MNLLSKTGLIPTLPCTNHHLIKQRIQITFDDIVLPAPFAFRPFSQYYNPYSNGCSILCNHPVDQDTKETIKKAKEILERKCTGIRNEFVHSDYNEDDVDDIFVPEVLFRKYTETDSRPQTPTPTQTNISVISRKTSYRRCITPDPTTLEPEKMQLVLDLRRSLSQNAMNYVSKTEEPSLSSAIASTSMTVKEFSYDFHRTSNQKRSISEKQKLQINREKLSMDTNVKKVQSAIKSYPNAGKNLKENKLDKSLKQKKKKKKKNNFKNIRKDAENEFKDLTEPKETQVSSYDETNPNNEHTHFEENNSQSNNNSDGADLKHDPYSIDPQLIKRIQREIDLETVNNEVDPQKRRVYEEVYAKSNSSRRSSIVNDEIKVLRRELRLNSLITNAETLFNLPRTFYRRNARFELPMDKLSLNGIEPLDYLKSYVYITNNSRLIYNQVFKLHLDAKCGENRLLPIHKILEALAQVMGRQFTELEQNELNDLTGLSAASHIDFRTWCGVCALCERIFRDRFAQKLLSKEEDPSHEIELVDFSLMEIKLNRSNVDPRLRKMLHKIRES